MSASDRAQLSAECLQSTATPDATSGTAATVCDASMVGNMNMNKDVATRLFRMLAVSEDTASSIKRDHASYGKLNLLTQQMQLLQAQAQRVVDNSETRAAKQARVAEIEPEISFSESGSTALAVSEEYDEGAKRLLSMVTTDEKVTALISRDAGASARLSTLAEQVSFLQEQAQTCVDEAELNRRLLALAATMPGTRLVPGTTFYLYTQNGKEVLSRIAHNEWSNYDEYHGKYLYDFDLTFRKLIGDGGIDVLSSAMPRPLMTLTDAKVCPSVAEAANTKPIMKPVCPVLSRW